MDPLNRLHEIRGPTRRGRILFPEIAIAHQHGIVLQRIPHHASGRISPDQDHALYAGGIEDCVVVCDPGPEAFCNEHNFVDAERSSGRFDIVRHVHGCIFSYVHAAATQAICTRTITLGNLSNDCRVQNIGGGFEDFDDLRAVQRNLSIDPPVTYHDVIGRINECAVPEGRHVCLPRPAGKPHHGRVRG